jgi:D-sedoheptulose 7-phosphate isomerase
LRGIEAAKNRNLYTIGFTGESGGQMLGRVESLFRVPSSHTPRIQETHSMIGHILCELIDRILFPEAWPQN